MKKLLILPLLLLTSCLSSKGSGDLDVLLGGDVEGISNVQITQTIPGSNSVVIQIGETEQFTAIAKGPPSKILKYEWQLNGSSVQSGANQSYSFSGNSLNIGEHIISVKVSESSSSDSYSWNVKVNGPPVLNKVTTGTPKVSVGSQTSIQLSAIDPNSDNLTYNWFLDGLPSPYLTSGSDTATLTGSTDILGQRNISVEVSDGSTTTTENWTVEINHFPNECNTMPAGSICTVAGSPSIGSGSFPSVSQQGIKISPRGIDVDTLGNIYIADITNSVVWLWNRTNSPLSRHGFGSPTKAAILPGQIVIVAGTGDQANGPDGLALDSALNQPWDVEYNDSNGELYISEWIGDKVKKVDSDGFVFTVMGNSNSNANGAVAVDHICDGAAGLELGGNTLYVACSGTGRVKAIDLSAFPTPTASTVDTSTQPRHLYLSNEGLYIATTTNTATGNRIRFLNLNVSPSKTFWGSVVIPQGSAANIIGEGNAANGSEDNIIPTSLSINNPSGIYVSGDHIYFSSNEGNRDGIYLANNGVDYQFGNHLVLQNRAKRLTLYSGTSSFNAMAGYNGSGVVHDLARVNNPYDLSFDPISNNLFFADFSNNRLRALNFTTFTINDMVGSGLLRSGFIGDTPLASGDHSFNNPSGIAIDNNNRIIYFTDSDNYRVRQVDRFGTIQTAAGKGSGDPIINGDVPTNINLRTNITGTITTSSLDFTSDNILIMANQQSSVIRAWNINNNVVDNFMGVYFAPNSVSTIAGDYILGNGFSGDGSQAQNAQLNRAAGVASYGSGVTRVTYIADTDNHCIRMVNQAGDISTIAGICESTANGTLNTGSKDLVTFNRPHQIAVDHENGNIVVADKENHKIRYINLNVSPSIVIGSTTIPIGHTATIACNNGNSSGLMTENTSSISARCGLPVGVAVNSNRICFSQETYDNVRCLLKSNGILSTIAGAEQSVAQAGSPIDFSQEGVAGTSARLNNPSGLSFDDSGDLYIVDRSNHIVRKYKFSP